MEGYCGRACKRVRYWGIPSITGAAVRGPRDLAHRSLAPQYALGYATVGSRSRRRCLTPGRRGVATGTLLWDPCCDPRKGRQNQTAYALSTQRIVACVTERLAPPHQEGSMVKTVMAGPAKPTIAHRKPRNGNARRWSGAYRTSCFKATRQRTGSQGVPGPPGSQGGLQGRYPPTIGPQNPKTKKNYPPVQTI